MNAVLDNSTWCVRAFAYTVLLFLIAGVLSLVFGTLLAAMRVGPVGVLRQAAAVYVTIVRNTPLLIVLIFFRIAGPKVGLNFNFVDITIGDIRFNNLFAACVVGLTVYTSAFVCEAIRSGINAVPLGQAEAARAIGLPVRRRDARGGAAPGVPGVGPAAGQRADRAAQEHHGRRRLRRVRGVRPDEGPHQRLRPASGSASSSPSP